MEKYILKLTAAERVGLEQLLEKKVVSALRRTRAMIMLRADDGLIDSDIADDIGVVVATVERIRKRAVLEGVEAALERKRQVRMSRKPKLDGRGEAKLVQLACSNPPDGRSRWTLSLLADKLVELNVVEGVSTTTIHRRLKKTASSHGR